MDTMQMNLLEADASFDGFVHCGRRKGISEDAWNGQIAAFEELLASKARLGRNRWEYEIREAFTSDVMPLLYGDVVERRMLDRLKGLTPVHDPIFAKRKVNHVGLAHAIKTKQAEGVAKRLQKIAQGGSYPVHTDVAKEFTYYCEKWGGRYDFFLEQLINDDLGYFNRMPQEFADSANNTKSYMQTSCFWNSAGPIDTFFNDSEIGQMGVSNLPLTHANLGTAIMQMMGSGSGYRTIRGEPFLNVPGYLVFGPALRVTAEGILESIDLSWGGYTTTLPQPVRNVLQKYRLEPVCDPWIPIIVTTGTIGATSWALFSKTIPAGEWADLNGHESPEIYMKAADAVRVGGGAVGPLDGSYDDDSLSYKLRMFGGCSALDPRAGWASDGQ